jgi:hypothetical protein
VSTVAAVMVLMYVDNFALMEICAGSERQKVAESEGERLKEASSINRSLSTLGLVINKLAGAHRQPAHVPYRDSRLTFLLQASHHIFLPLSGYQATIGR